MLQLINDLPPQVAGIHAFADVTGTEYANTLIPLLDDQLKKSRKINFILVLETDIKNFAPGMWCGNVKIGLKYFFRWMNIGYEEEPLEPYMETGREVRDDSRIGRLIHMGYHRSAILHSLEKEGFDEIHANYLLLGERKAEVGKALFKRHVCECFFD